jgi:hypothetical protein
MRTNRRHRRSKTVRRLTLATCVCSVALGLTTTPAFAKPKPPVDPLKNSPSAVDTTSVAPEKRTEILGKAWEASTDRAWITIGDAEAFHFFVADGANGYAWKEIAAFSEPGLETDQWIGNACVTSSGKKAVVVYAPRTFTNKGTLFDRGGFTAVVDLTTGAIKKLPIMSSLA